MEKKTSKPVLETHHKKTQSGENEAESKRQPQPERVLLVDKPYQIKKKAVKPVEKIKEPKRGLGVAKLEILRLEGKLKHMTEQLELLQAEKGITAAASAAAVPPPPPLLLPRPQPQPQHHQQFQVPFPPLVDPRQQYPNGMIPAPYGRFVPVGNIPASGAMNNDGPHPHPHHMNVVFQPLNQNGGYPGEPMNVIPNGGFPTGNGGGFIPDGHHEPNNTNMINGNGRGGGSPAAGHHQLNNNMNGNGRGGHHHHEPNNNMNENGGGFPGGEVNNAGNPYMYLDQQLRVQHLKLMHSARELCAIQRLQYRPPRPSKFSVQMNPVINREEPRSKDKMVMNDSLELSLGSTTNMDENEKINNDDEEVEEVDAFGVGRRRRRRRSTSSSAVMEYNFFPGESSDNRSSSYSGGGGGGGMGGSSEASTSNENTNELDLSLKLSL